MLLEGVQLGRYYLLHRLGMGAMGEVYLANDKGINRQVAIKVIRRDRSLSNDPEKAEQLFQREMQIVAQLNHPHILPLFDYGEGFVHGGFISYMVMPFCPDGSLAMWLEKRQRTRLSLATVVHIIQQAASPLQYAHDQHIIHRDIKPSNFLIRANRTQPDFPDLLLADFGLAQFIDTSIQTSGTVVGTPTYMAPEQWRGHPVPATDQYMLAAMAYELLTGQPPFRGSLQQLMYQHTMDRPAVPSTINALVPPDLDIVIMHALAKQPEQRFATLTAFARAFQQAASASANPVKVSMTVASNDRLAPDNMQTIPLPPSQYRPASQSALVENTTTLPLSPSQAMIRPPLSPPLLPVPTDQPAQSVATPAERGVNIKFAAHKKGLHCSVVFLMSLVLTVALVVGGIQLSFVDRPLANPSTTSPITLKTATAAAQNTGPVVAPPHAPTTTPMPAPTPASTIPNPYPPHIGTMVLNDALNDQSSTAQWEQNMYCQFTNGAYHSSTTGAFNSCIAKNTNFYNFAYQVQMTIISGNQAGIVFYANKGQGMFYYFHLSTTGAYALDLYTNNSYAHSLVQGNSAIDPHQAVQIAIVASNNTFTLYLNTQTVDTIPDTTLSQGQIGVAVSGDNTPTEAAFSKAQVWTL